MTKSTSACENRETQERERYLTLCSLYDEFIRIPSTNRVLPDVPLVPNFASCEKIRSIVKRKCTWP